MIFQLPFSEIAEATDSCRSPELPIHVVQPNPTILKPCSFRYFCRPLHKKYINKFKFSTYFSKIVQTAEGQYIMIQITEFIF